MVSWERGRATKKGTDNKKCRRESFQKRGIMVHGVQCHCEVKENKDKMPLDLAFRRPLLVSGIMDRGPTATRCLCGKFFIRIFSVEIERVRHLSVVTEPGDLSPIFPALPPTSGCFPRFSKSLSS